MFYSTWYLIFWYCIYDPLVTRGTFIIFFFRDNFSTNQRAVEICTVAGGQTRGLHRLLRRINAEKSPLHGASKHGMIYWFWLFLLALLFYMWFLKKNWQSSNKMCVVMKTGFEAPSAYLVIVVPIILHYIYSEFWFKYQRQYNMPRKKNYELKKKKKRVEEL